MVMLPLSLRLRLLALASVGLGLCACGGRDASEPEQPVDETGSALPSDACRADLEAAGYTFITERPFATDFEQGRLSDDWFLSIDPSPDAEVIDGADDPIVNPAQNNGRVPQPSEFEGRRCTHVDGSEDSEGNWALHLQGTGLDQWGISLTQDYWWQTSTGALDGTEWDGVSFWVRRGPGDVGRSMFAGISEWHTRAPNDDDAEARDRENSFCEDFGDLTELKCDRFGVGVGVDEEWRFVAIPFSAMMQQGWGAAAPCPYIRELWGLAFQMSAGDWDIWLDDVAYYRLPDDERPPQVECDDARPEDYDF